jgi:integrase
LRVALAPEAAQLLAALGPEDRLPYAIAFHAGLRRSEIYRLEWPDVLEGERIATRLIVRRSKSEAGTARRPPIADNLREVLAAAWERQGSRSTARSSTFPSCPARSARASTPRGRPQA